MTFARELLNFMATVTKTRGRTIGPEDHGRRMSLDQFAGADFQDGWLYELARGVVVVTEVPYPNHGRIVNELARLFILYNESHPNLINYRAGGGECRLRLEGMQSDRHPDQAVYLTPPPPGKSPWAAWVPEIVVEVLSAGSRTRDLVEKREEYLRAGVAEYWILDPDARTLTVLVRAADVWKERLVSTRSVYRTRLLPGLEVRPAQLLGPATR